MINQLREMGCEMDSTMKRFMNDQEFYIECFDKFVNDREIEQLREVLDTKNVQQAFDYAHQLKGTLSNLGLIPVLDQLSEIVEILRAGSWDGIEQQYQKLLDIWNEIKNKTSHS